MLNCRLIYGIFDKLGEFLPLAILLLSPSAKSSVFRIMGRARSRSEPAARHPPVNLCQVSLPRSVTLTGPASAPAPESAVIRPSRSSGRTTNVTNPPPPAPDTLPARAPWAKAIPHKCSIRLVVIPEAVSFFALQESARMSATASMSPWSSAFSSRWRLP